MGKAWLIVGGLYSLASLPCAGQVNAGRVIPRASSNVRLQIGAPTSHPVYRIGETIRLELAFSASGPPQFHLTRLYPLRHPLVTRDRVAVEPSSGWEDPLAGFFRSCPLILNDSGLYDNSVLSVDPVKVPLILNDWIRFRIAGDYFVTVDSSRLVAIGAARKKPAPTVKSDQFHLQIIPASRDWQLHTFKDAMRVLNSNQSDSLEQREQRRNALDTVRFLGTDEAARAMTRLLAVKPYSLNLLEGLVTSPARDIVEHEMRSLLVDPHFPVTREFPCALAIVANPPGEDSATAARQSALEARFREELRAALPRKIGTAREISSVAVDNRP